MNLQQQWLDKVKAHQVVLAALIADYHPAARARVRDRQMANRVVDDMPITAPMAERACSRVRESIAAEYKTDPVVDFDNAIKSEDTGKIIVILNQAWFGVPESTSCWKIPGFGVAVELIDGLPDPEPGPEELEAAADMQLEAPGDLHNGDADRDQGTDKKPE